MELFSPKIKNYLIFSQKKKKFFLYFGKQNFIALRLKNFWRELFEFKKFLKKHSEKISYISRNGTF